MSQYTSKDGQFYKLIDKSSGQFYKLIDKSSGEFIAVGMLEEGSELATIHTVEFIDQVKYESLTVDDATKQ